VIDALIVCAGMFATVSPLGALASVLWYRCDRSATGMPDPLTAQQLLLSPIAAFAVLTLFALAGGPLLDAFDISGSSFEFAAAAAMAPLAIRLLVAGDSTAIPRQQLRPYAWLAPFAFPMLAGPVSIIAAIAYGQRTGEIETIIATAIVLAIAAALFATLSLWEKQRLIAVQMSARLSGVLLAGMAIEMALDGLRSI
jgi:multiple antibiotic resistance protein